MKEKLFALRQAAAHERKVFGLRQAAANETNVIQATPKNLDTATSHIKLNKKRSLVFTLSIQGDGGRSGGRSPLHRPRPDEAGAQVQEAVPHEPEEVAAAARVPPSEVGRRGRGGAESRQASSNEREIWI